MFYFIAKAASDQANAGESSVVTCSGLDCSLCKLIEMVVNILGWFLWVSFAVAILFVVIGGFIYIGARGREKWMLQAKRTIFWAISGFAIVLLANLAIRTILKIAGVSDMSIIDQFECNSSDSTSSIVPLPQKELSALIESAKSGGELSGTLAKGISTDELSKAIDNLSPNDLLIIEAEVGQTKKTLMTIGKDSNKQPKLLYIDGAAINQLLQTKKTSLILNEANAKENTVSNVNTNSNAAINVYNRAAQELIVTISQTIAKIIEKNQDLIIIITNKPTATGELTANAIVKTVSKINQCIESGGSWYRFSEACQAEQESCSAQECTSSGNPDLVTGCKCNGKCLNAGQCVDRK